MKSKCSFILKSSIALILAVLMLFGSISTVLAATVDMATTGGGGSKTGTWYLKSDGKGSWDDSGIAKANMGDDYNWSFYLTPTDGDLYWRYWSSSDKNNLGARTNDVDNNGGNDDAHKNGIWGSTNSWKYALTNLGSGSDYYTVTIHLDPDGGYCGNSGNTYYAGWTWVTSSKKASMSPVITTKKGSTSATSFTAGDTVSLSSSVTSGSNYGTVSYSYRYKLSTASTWTNVTGTTFTAPSTAGTYTVEVTATDGGVIKGTNARSARTETSTKNITVTQAATTYTSIAADAKGSTDGSTFNTTLSGTPATISANSYTTGTSALNISAGTVSGYTFYKWVVTAGSGTIGSATTASTTFTPSKSNTTVTAQYKKNYTFSNGTTDTHGTVTVPSGTVLAGASYSGKVTPADGYKIKSLTVGGVAVSAAEGKTSAYTYSGTTGSSTTGTSTPISVVATFEPITNLQLYIAGRFRVRPSAGSSSWTTTYASGSDWNATSTNIPFTYVSGTTYKVDTYASLKELSAQPTNNQDPWFFVYDKTNSKAWHPTTQNRELGTTTEYNLTTNTDTYNVRFNSSSDDSPVTIYFDYNTKRLWYTIPDLYDVTVDTATGGTVTASPARAEADTEITLTITPTTGYQLKSINAKKGTTNVTLSGTGNTRTFTMPAGDVTVTPEFEKISYAVSVDAKYSNNGTDFNQTFPSDSKPDVTIAADTATQIDGVKVTAPGTDPTGYIFAGWDTTTGSFTAPNDKETTFKPNAANAVAIARYKKLHTVTISIDNTGTGAGTATVNLNSVPAGGSYTITATAKPGSAVESVTVNGTAKTASASQTISPVSADQTVVVKFKSNVTIRGGSTIGTNWDSGDAMTSNAAGTEFTKAYTNVAGSSSGTSYEFKLHNGTSYSDDSSATVTITGGASTGTMTTKASAGVNWKLTLKKAANVTIKSDGTKITEIKVVPADATKYKVTFKKADNTTITGSYEGTNFTTASADATVQVYSGDEISFTVTAASGYYINDLTSGTTPAFGPGESKTYKLSNVTEEKTIIPKAAAIPTITAKTNKSDYGTVSITTNSIVPGSTFQIKVSPKSGQLTNLSYEVNGSGSLHQTVTLYPKSGGSNSAPASVGALAELFDLSKLNLNKVDLAATGEDTTYTSEVVPNNTTSITVNATFSAYSAESNYYYNYYSNSGKGTSSQMTEGMINGATFSYYHVTDRSDNDQLFTVSKKTEASGSYVYFTTDTSTDWKMTYGSQPTAYFFNAQGSVGTAFPGSKMTWSRGSDDNQNKDWKIEIPSGATSVIFTNGKSGSAQKQTVDLTLADGNGCYVVGNYDNSSGHYNCTQWSTPASDAGTGMHEQEWFSTQDDQDIYPGTNSAYTGAGLFNDHGLSSVRVAKPKGDDFTDSKTDYYIVLFYPGITYSIEGSEFTPSNNPLVYWMSELPGGTDDNVTIYAKDGSIRSDTNGSTYANIADTKIYAANGTTTVGTDHSGNVANQTYQTYKATKGETVVIKTQIGATDSGTLSNSDALIAKYYVRGFCVNGEVSELLEWNANGLYTLTYKIPEDTEISKLEITPIYYLKDTTANPIVTYRVTGFTDELKQVGAGKPGWGDTLYTYPFYGKLGSNNNALGAYPGQPMVYYKGQYQMQIPEQSTAWDIYEGDAALGGKTGTEAATAVHNTNVSGVTMSNGYYDIVHRQIMGYGSNGASADHVQTYDYGDFYKIFNEKKPVDNIVFDFKYRTKKHNFENQPGTTISKTDLDTNYGTNGNGFELLTNFHGRNVDLFGTPLSGDAADPNKTTPVYVVSIGGVNETAHTGVENIAGYYATEWMVYGSSNGTNYSRISAGGKNSIPPEVLVLNDDDNTSFNDTTYPSADANHVITNWKALYTALEEYRGKPVMISYEAADAQQGQSMFYAGTGGATRNDGRWLYSKNGENITSNIKIQYSENGTDYVDYTESSTVTGLEAYFTNADAYKKQTYATTIDPDKTFDFEAKTTNSDYMFVGWYMADGTKITSDNASHTERSGSYTFVAKFKKVTEGQLVLSHSVATGKIMTIGSADYTLDGSGTAKIGAVVKDHESGEILATYEPDTNDIILDKKYIGSEKDYDVEVTLVAKADENTALGTTELVEDATKGVLNDPFFNNPTTDESVYKQRTYTFSFNVKSDLYGGTTTQKTTSLIYHSYFIQYKFNYTLNYEYIDRNGQSKQMKRMGTLTSAEANTYIEKRGDTRYLLTSFIEKMAPYESNFGQDITWNFTDVEFGGTGSNYEYSLNQHFTANQENLNKRNITFALPYQHNNGVAVMTNGVGTKDTTRNLELIAVTDEDGKITQDNRVDFNTIPVLPNNGENGIFTEKGKKNWIAAPATIKDGNSVLNFQYWSVKPTDRAGENDPDVARCYFQGFNFVAYDNYIITPVYGASTVEPSDFGKNTNITYVETNRNQWNTNGTDYDYKTQKDKAADLLYNDFIVAYNYDGKDIFNGDADGEISELGVVVERIQKLEIKDDGTYDTTLSRYTGIETHENEVDKVINGTSTEKNYTKHAIATNNLDNKNRIQFYNGVYNTAGWKQNTEGGTPTAYYTYKNYVYRAYSYMKLTNGTIIKSAVPAYFTMYDVATADAADM